MFANLGTFCYKTHKDYGTSILISQIANITEMSPKNVYTRFLFHIIPNHISAKMLPIIDAKKFILARIVATGIVANSKSDFALS